MDTALTQLRLNLTELVKIARTLEHREAIAAAICAHAVTGLGLAGASINLVTRNAGDPRLESIAAVGQHSSFIREMSMPLDNLTDASRTALGGEPIFVGNPHGVPEDAAQAVGVGRWRGGFGAHAYAVLALTVLEGTIGVLTLEWPEPYPFADADRRNLQLFADVVALMLRPSPSDASQATEGDRPISSLDDASLAAYQANARGLVVPEQVAASWETPPTARVWTAVAPTRVEVDSVAFAEVLGTPHGGVMTAVGTVSAGSVDGAGQATSAAREVMRAAAMRGSAPGEVLAMIGSSLQSQALGAYASGIVATLYSATGALEIATAGAVALAHFGREGRFELSLPETPPVGTGRVAASQPATAVPAWRPHRPAVRRRLIAL